MDRSLSPEIKWLAETLADTDSTPVAANWDHVFWMILPRLQAVFVNLPATNINCRQFMDGLDCDMARFTILISGDHADASCRMIYITFLVLHNMSNFLASCVQPQYAYFQSMWNLMNLLHVRSLLCWDSWQHFWKNTPWDQLCRTCNLKTIGGCTSDMCHFPHQM